MIQQFALVPKAYSKVRLCLDPAQLNQALLGPMHRGPMLNDIMPKLNNIRYMSIIDASSGYPILKLDDKSSYLTTFAYQFGSYRYKLQVPIAFASKCLTSAEYRYSNIEREVLGILHGLKNSKQFITIVL